MRYLPDAPDAPAVRWMQSAAEMAKCATCHRAKCGTVIVANNQIIGQGYNAPPLDDEANRTCDTEPGPGKPKYDRTCCVHAEWRAILDAARRHPKEIIGSTLYFTRVDDRGEIKKSGQPFCTVCSRLALDAGLAAFVLWHETGIAEYQAAEYNRLSYQYVPERT